MDRKRYFRFIYRRSFRYLGAALVIALVVGALLGGGIYTVNAVCAAGCVLVCWGWFTYLKMTGMRFFKRFGARKKVQVPYLHRKDKGEKNHRPAFRMDSEDFDDDLTAATVVSEELFSKRQQEAAAAIARAVSGGLMILLSFFIPIP